MTAAVVEAVEALGRVSGERGLGIDGVHVHRRDAVPVERHWAADLRRDVFSVSKTVTSVAVGIAEGEGLLRLDDPVLQHLAGLASRAAGGVEEVTLRHLLTMTSGLTWRWEDEDADHPGDAAADVLAGPPVAAPGSLFRYRGGSTYLLSRVVRACSGADLRDYLLPRLFVPLGIANPQWHRCPLGHSLGATGLFLRTAEIGRLGETLLDGGRFAGRQLVPAAYVAALSQDSVPTDGHVATNASAPHPENARYGRHVWICARDGAWRMDGILGQFCVVLPDRGACVSVTSHYRGPTTDILDALWEDVVPSLA